MDKPIINVSMDDGTNKGSGLEDYSPTFSGGSFENGKFVLNGKGYLSVPTPFMNGTGTWTVAFRIDAYTPSSNSYSRFARGNNDVPSLFYTRSYSKSQTKLAYGSANTSYATIVDSTIISTSSSAILLNIPQGESTLFVFRNDGEYITLWVNGVKILQEAASRYTSDKYASTFSIGDDAGSSYYMSHLECSLLKLWDVALSDADILKVEIDHDMKYLIRSNSTLYTITDGALTALTESEVTASLFQTYGLDELPDGSLLLSLTDPEVLYWHDSTDELPALTIRVTGSPPVPQTVITGPQDMSDPTILGIESASVDASDDVLFALSFDDGGTWKAYSGTGWVTLGTENAGMTKATMENIGLEAWAEVVTSASYRVRFTMVSVNSYVAGVVINYINKESEEESDA